MEIWLWMERETGVEMGIEVVVVVCVACYHVLLAVTSQEKKVAKWASIHTAGKRDSCHCPHKINSQEKKLDLVPRCLNKRTHFHF